MFDLVKNIQSCPLGNLDVVPVGQAIVNNKCGHHSNIETGALYRQYAGNKLQLVIANLGYRRPPINLHWIAGTSLVGYRTGRTGNETLAGKKALHANLGTFKGFTVPSLLSRSGGNQKGPGRNIKDSLT